MFFNKLSKQKERELFEKELELLKNKKELEWEREYLDKLKQAQQEIEEKRKEYMEDTIKLRKLEEKLDYQKKYIENMESIIDVRLRYMREKYEAIIAEKDEIIEDLQENIKVLISKLPKVDLKDFKVVVEQNK